MFNYVLPFFYDLSKIFFECPFLNKIQFKINKNGLCVVIEIAYPFFVLVNHENDTVYHINFTVLF
ncbi:hypothetical protein C1H87_04715 [Flavivirga eckloniae]|uniref:Uncharacterized protein n=1 Tax=Flavivirga eckloniae TaxID=1803846 RepID=A0A2K9PLX0_9FLAO|nr:hypothetical protein C1H87_04715 [Flavivirga eckloniae]